MNADSRRDESKVSPELQGFMREVEHNRERVAALTAALESGGITVQALHVTFALGYVSLRGTVASAKVRAAAEALVRQDPFVRVVRNGLEIG